MDRSQRWCLLLLYLMSKDVTVAFLPCSINCGSQSPSLSQARKTFSKTTLNIKDIDKYFPEENEDGENQDDDDESDGLVTKEMFLRDMLKDPETKRKKRNGSRYRTLDNRDALPFLVKEVTPDPYTPIEKKRKEAIKNTIKDREKTAAKKGGKEKKVKRDLLGNDKGIAASIYQETKDGSLEKVLGEFNLDKSTNCGDIIDFGDKTFEVQRARCQYKYAGGQRFVMVRKILEVKDVTRVEVESQLMKQFKDNDSEEES
mmetsp:Transcript_26896/g.37904  ORF Transcript_26896/g.37904 Transcript_26896/m.37904 type:complete len:258 (-) Transcript_26896:18-791(-)